MPTRRLLLRHCFYVNEPHACNSSRRLLEGGRSQRLRPSEPCIAAGGGPSQCCYAFPNRPERHAAGPILSALPLRETACLISRPHTRVRCQSPVVNRQRNRDPRNQRSAGIAGKPPAKLTARAETSVEAPRPVRNTHSPRPTN